MLHTDERNFHINDTLSVIVWTKCHTGRCQTQTPQTTNKSSSKTSGLLAAHDLILQNYRSIQNGMVTNNNATAMLWALRFIKASHTKQNQSCSQNILYQLSFQNRAMDESKLQFSSNVISSSVTRNLVILTMDC